MNQTDIYLMQRAYEQFYEDYYQLGLTLTEVWGHVREVILELAESLSEMADIFNEFEEQANKQIVISPKEYGISLCCKKHSRVCEPNNWTYIRVNSPKNLPYMKRSYGRG